MVGRDLAREVTTREPVVFEADEGTSGPRIIALDTGIKRSIIRNFTSRGATLELYPCTTPAAGAARPRSRRLLPRATAPATRRRSTTSSTPSGRSSARSPCSASASATSCSRAPSAWRPTSCPFGHRGANHPVKDLRTGRIAITSQNHGFAVSGEVGGRIESDARRRRADAREPLRRHRRGPRLLDVPAGTVQYHPEAGPGPQRRARPVRRVHRPFEGARCRCPAATTSEASSSSAPGRS